MGNDRLSDDERARMATPLWEQARAAYRDNRPDDGDRLLDNAVSQWSALKDYSINWITSLLTFVGEELGEEAVERALRKTGDEFVRPRRDTGTDWGSLPASARAKVIARAMVSNMGEVEVDEDDEKIVLSFRCGTGGRLIDDGGYEGEYAYFTLREQAGRTFMTTRSNRSSGVARPRASSTRPSARASPACTTCTRTWLRSPTMLTSGSGSAGRHR